MGTVDAALNSTDLGTKFHLRRRFEELLMMLPLRIGVWLISSYGAEVLSMDRADSENRDVSFIDKLSLSTWWIWKSPLACFWEGTASPTHQESRPRMRMQSRSPVPGVIMRFWQSLQLAVQPRLPMLSALLWNLSALSSFILCVLSLSGQGCAPTNLSVRRKS